MWAASTRVFLEVSIPVSYGRYRLYSDVYRRCGRVCSFYGDGSIKVIGPLYCQITCAAIDRGRGVSCHCIHLPICL